MNSFPELLRLKRLQPLSVAETIQAAKHEDDDIDNVILK